MRLAWQQFRHTGIAALPLQAADVAGRRAWGMLWHAVLRMLWYCGFLAVPAVQFLVGSTAYDVLHGAYWAGLLLHLGGATLQLKPPLRMVRCRVVVGPTRSLEFQGGLRCMPIAPCASPAKSTNPGCALACQSLSALPPRNP